jgi:hypothetical protein
MKSIRISEFLPAPRDRYAQEWVELENTAAEEINLGGWQIDDVEGGGSPLVLSADYIIGASSFVVIELNKALLNNDGDTLRLLTPDGTVVDEVTFEASSPDQSFSLVEGVWSDTVEPSPGMPNQAAAAPLADSPAQPAMDVAILPTTASVGSVAVPVVAAEATHRAAASPAVLAGVEALYQPQAGQVYLFAPAATTQPPIARSEVAPAALSQEEDVQTNTWFYLVGALFLLLAGALFWAGRTVLGEEVADDTGA